MSVARGSHPWGDFPVPGGRPVTSGRRRLEMGKWSHESIWRMSIQTSTQLRRRRTMCQTLRFLSLSYLVLALLLGSAAPVSGATQISYRASIVGQETAHIESCLETKGFVVGRLIFHYPTCWTTRTNVGSSMESSGLVALSNQVMHNPCHSKGSGSNVTVTCGFPVTTLNRGGVLVEVIEGGRPGWKIDSEPGRHLIVDKHAARELVTDNPSGRLRATEEISIFIDPDVANNYYEIFGLIRGPHVADNQLLLQKIVQSVRFDSFE